MKALVRNWRLGLLVSMVLLFALIAWVGWFSPVRGWQEATGWDLIPEPERPTSTRLWDDGPAGEPAPQLFWLGHSGFLLEWHATRLLLDPNTNSHCTVARRVLEPVDLKNLGRVDAALISHAHFDHLDLPTLSSLAQLQAVVLPAGSEPYLNGAHLRRVTVLPIQPGTVQPIAQLEVIAVPAAHNGNRFHPLRSRQLAVGYIIRPAQQRPLQPHSATDSPAQPASAAANAIYFAGDTGLRNDFAAIAAVFHPRVAILPIGSHAPRFPLERYHLNPEQAVAVAKTLGVETVVPCHFGTFTLALDRPAAALPRFAHAAFLSGVRWVMPALFRPPEV